MITLRRASLNRARTVVHVLDGEVRVQALHAEARAINESGNIPWVLWNILNDARRSTPDAIEWQRQGHEYSKNYDWSNRNAVIFLEHIVAYSPITEFHIRRNRSCFGTESSWIPVMTRDPFINVSRVIAGECSIQMHVYIESKSMERITMKHLCMLIFFVKIHPCIQGNRQPWSRYEGNASVAVRLGYPRKYPMHATSTHERVLRYVQCTRTHIFCPRLKVTFSGRKVLLEPGWIS